MSALPSLHRRIRTSFLRVVFLFWCTGMLMLAAVWFTGRLPLQMVRLNYDSIVWASEMERACDALLAPRLYPERTPAGWRAFFEDNLEHAEQNVTERDEGTALAYVRSAWEEFQKAERPDAMAVKAGLRELERINEKGLFQRLDAGLRWRDAVLLAGGLGLLVVAVASVFVADAVSARIAHPLRRAAELLRARPVPGRSLSLPEPQTLDVRVLFDELTRQWDWLGELDALNVQRLLEEKHKLELVLESVEDAILALDARGRVLLVSRRMLGIVGMSREEIEGRPWHELTFSGNLRKRPEGADNRVDLDKLLSSPARGECEIGLTEEGEHRAFRARSRDLIIDGSPAGRLLLLTDVTEKAMRDTLRAEMMDWIGHELKTPVQSLGLASDLLNRQREDVDDSLGILIDTVRQDTERLRAVVRQFMDIAGMTPAMLRLFPERVELGVKLDEWLAPFRLTAREKGQELVLTRDNPVFVNIDVERFAWLLSNLVSNALRETPPGRRVEVGLRTARDAGKSHAEMSVEDEGPGIAPEQEQRLFQPYSHGLTKGTRQGLAGLGLAISRHLAEAHGGALRYERGAHGGARFVVELPLADEEANGKQEEEDDAAQRVDCG